MKLANIPDILKLMPKSHRYFAVGPILLIVLLSSVIIEFSGVIQALALILVFVVVLAGMNYVYELSKPITPPHPDGEGNKYGIVRFWADRAGGIRDIKKEVLESQNEIFISGIILNSIRPWIRN